MISLRSTVLFAITVATIFRLAGHFTDPRPNDEAIHRVTGGAATAADAADPPRQLRIVTWNIERGTRFDGILATLRATNADVILLQEVDRFCRRSDGRDVGADLAAGLGMHWVSAGEFQEIGEGRRDRPALIGQTILSRTPIATPSTIVFEDQAWFRWRFNPLQPRRGGRMVLKARTAGVLVYTVHLESGGTDGLRRRQVDQLLADAARETDALVVIGGDFNNTARARPALIDAVSAKGFSDALRGEATVRTSIRHRHPIDWIFVRGSALANGAVQRVEGLSDHYPLVATLVRR